MQTGSGRSLLAGLAANVAQPAKDFLIIPSIIDTHIANGSDRFETHDQTVSVIRADLIQLRSTPEFHKITC